ncbi:hypothetical protein TNCT_231321 [Trichonephila clavata]|uniref:Uncharacterized protein n=1 Tax=Trichonephila clavata TaxID=2740835 RepID=A0A8X6K120_TRICU|nr:hypothetical protein TNCT_231321 [Trichonephila clavata]
MNSFTNQELADMLLTYGQQAKAAAEINKFTKIDILTDEYYRTKCLHVCFVSCANVVHCAAICTKRVKTTDVDCQRQRVQQSIEYYTNTGTRAIAQPLGVCQSEQSVE